MKLSHSFDKQQHNVGLNSIGGGLESTVRMMLKHYGIDPDKDVKFLATGTVDTRFAALKQGLTVATAGSTPVDYLGKNWDTWCWRGLTTCSVSRSSDDRKTVINSHVILSFSEGSSFNFSK